MIYGSLRLITDKLHYNSAIFLDFCTCLVHSTINYIKTGRRIIYGSLHLNSRYIIFVPYFKILILN